MQFWSPPKQTCRARPLQTFQGTIWINRLKTRILVTFDLFDLTSLPTFSSSKFVLSASFVPSQCTVSVANVLSLIISFTHTSCHTCCIYDTPTHLNLNFNQSNQNFLFQDFHQKIHTAKAETDMFNLHMFYHKGIDSVIISEHSQAARMLHFWHPLKVQRWLLSAFSCYQLFPKLNLSQARAAGQSADDL